MAWKMSITGIPLCLQILDDNNLYDIDVKHNPEADENILALAELAVHKAFVCVQLFHESRDQHREDALQEAALAITEYAGKGPCTAYSLAKKRTISWVVRQLWQGRHQTPKDKREGKRAIPPTPFSLDAQDWEMGRGGDVSYTRSPEEVMVVSEEIVARERCIERF